MSFACMIFLQIAFSSTSLAEQPWRFIVTCDSRGSDSGINQRILGELVAEIKKQGVDFVLFPGDLVSGYSTTGPSQFEAQLKQWVDLMKPVYDAGIGVYVGRGNHELADLWYISSGYNTDPNDNYARRWLNVFGIDLYPAQKLPANGPAGEKYMTYSVTHKNAFIVCLDQYAGVRHEFAHKVNQGWLDAQLAANTKAHVFAAGHELAFRALPRECLDKYPTDRDAFWVSLRNAGARTYLCGHDHFYDHARVDDGDGDPDNDIHQYTIGTAGAYLYTWSPPYDGNNSDYIVEQVHHAGRYGYVLVDVNDLDVTLTWMQRSTNNLSIDGIYEAGEVWSYGVLPRPVVLSPNGGENLVAESDYTITWKTLEGAKIDYVMIEYSCDNGLSWKEADVWQNIGSYQWKTPAVDSDRCLLRISDLRNPTIADTSDSVFTIFQCRRRLSGDLNGDCYVDALDLAILAGDWLKCANPFDPACDAQE